ncbi:hypothetical protein [Erythrobacter sp. Dej080120_24]|uniref:hypothetical protein n=1 Tax=Erythrobacter sp. Dej080120_24 TaxID=3024837 RepID=UPI0030C729A9
MGSLGDFRVRMAEPVRNARLAHTIARMTNQPLSAVSHAMSEGREMVLFEFRLWGQLSENKTEQVEQILDAFEANEIEAIVEEWAGNGWKPLRLLVLRNIIASGLDIAADTQRHIDLESGQLDGGIAP